MMEHPPPNRKRIFKGILIAFNLLVLIGVIKLVQILFPSNASFKSRINPVILSQNSSEQPGKLRHLHLTLMPYTGFHHPPNTTEKGYFGGVRFKFRTNNHGFLCNDDFFPFEGRKRPKGEKDRIVFLTGGSAAYGWGATSNETTIAYVLEKLLNDHDKDHHWEVISLAMGSWIAYQQFIALDLYGSEFVPDWVVTFDGRNDMLVPTASGEKVPNYYYYTAQKRLNSIFEDDADRKPSGLFSFAQHRWLSRKLDEVAKAPEPYCTSPAISAISGLKK